MLVPVVALYAAELGAGVGVAGLIVGLYSIINTPANIVFGRIIDRIGHRLPLAGGLFGDAVAMLLYIVSASPLHLALVRAFHGLAGAAAGPATMSAISGYAGRDREGRAMGIYGMSIAVANLVGFGVGGMVFSRLGAGWLFSSAAAVLLVGVGLSLLLPRPQPRPVGTRRTAAGPGLVVTLLKRPGLAAAYLAIFAQYFTFGGVVTLLPLLLRGKGLDAFHMGMLLVVFSVVFILGQWPAGLLSDRKGRRLPLAAGLVLGIMALLLLPWQDGFGAMAAVMALYGVAFGLLFPSVSALVADYSRPDERGLATGVFHALLTAGVAVGAPVVGWAGEALGVETGLAVVPVVMAVVLVAAVVLLRRAGEKMA